LLMFGREMQKDVIDHEGDMPYRPAPLLVGRASRAFGSLYPVMLFAAGILLYLATYSTVSAIGIIGPLILLVMIFVAAARSALKRSSHQAQAQTIKLASYWLVIVLISRGL
jgi:hypothetical protein